MGMVDEAIRLETVQALAARAKCLQAVAQGYREDHYRVIGKGEFLALVEGAEPGHYLAPSPTIAYTKGDKLVALLTL